MLLLNREKATKPYQSFLYRHVHRIFPRGGEKTRMPPRGGGEITPTPPTYVHTNDEDAAVRKL